MEPIDHPPGHEIERLNREIEEQHNEDDVETWDVLSWKYPVQGIVKPEPETDAARS